MNNRVATPDRQRVLSRTMVSIARSTLNGLKNHQKSALALSNLVLVLAVIALSVIMSKINDEKKLFAASNANYAENWAQNYVAASAWVEPGSNGELNSFVEREFGTGAECSWSKEAVLCTVGNVTKRFVDSGLDEHHGNP